MVLRTSSVGSMYVGLQIATYCEARTAACKSSGRYRLVHSLLSCDKRLQCVERKAVSVHKREGGCQAA